MSMFGVNVYYWYILTNIIDSTICFILQRKWYTHTYLVGGGGGGGGGGG